MKHFNAILIWFTENHIENKKQCEFLLEKAETKYSFSKRQLYEGCFELRKGRTDKDLLENHLELLGKMSLVGINACIAGVKLREAIKKTESMKTKYYKEVKASDELPKDLSKEYSVAYNSPGGYENYGGVRGDKKEWNYMLKLYPNLIWLKEVTIEMPSDEEVEIWFDENIGYDKDKPCSASSAIYKFRLYLIEWLKSQLTDKS